MIFFLIGISVIKIYTIDGGQFTVTGYLEVILCARVKIASGFFIEPALA